MNEPEEKEALYEEDWNDGDLHDDFAKKLKDELAGGARKDDEMS